MLKNLANHLPYYAVIFISTRKDQDPAYEEMAAVMCDLASQEEGFLGMHSARQETGITVSYWKTEEDLLHWKQQKQHVLAQRLGKEQWYEEYLVKVCRVEREYGTK